MTFIISVTFLEIEVSTDHRFLNSRNEVICYYNFLKQYCNIFVFNKSCNLYSFVIKLCFERLETSNQLLLKFVHFLKFSHHFDLITQISTRFDELKYFTKNINILS